MPKSNCRNCEIEFTWFPSQSKGMYCCNRCQADYVLKEAINSGNYTKSNALTYFKRFTDYRCSCCGINEWNGKPLTLQVDHIDGNNSNNLIENFRYLCPNCHTQTETWGVKNVKDTNVLSEAGKKGRAKQLMR